VPRWSVLTDYTKDSGFFMQINLSLQKQFARMRASNPPAREAHPMRRFVPWITLLAVIVLWQLAVSFNWVSPALIPAPQAVLDKFGQVLADGRLATHTATTLYEVVAGLALGVSTAVTLGYLIARIPLLEDVLSPIIVAMQSTPVVAYAPLLIIWFGSGATSKIVICALIVFFPMLMNTVVGIRNVPADLRDLMRVSQASRWQTLIKLEVPAAMPVLLAGLKTSATLSVVGAVVGEFINASSGLGFMISIARNQYDTPLVYVGVITLAVLARLLYGLVSMLERRLLVWQHYS
jgi:NitT/TauT family transport system permease protein